MLTEYTIDATPLATIPINAIPSVPFDEPLTNMLNVFQEGEQFAVILLLLMNSGRSHMAIVSRRPRHIENDRDDNASVMTDAAGGLRQRFMRKVAEMSYGAKSDSNGSEDSASGSEEDIERGEKQNKKRNRKTRKSGSSASSPTAVSQPEQDETKDHKRGIAQAAKLSQLEQTVPADAEMPPAMVEKVSREKYSG